MLTLTHKISISAIVVSIIGIVVSITLTFFKKEGVIINPNFSNDEKDTKIINIRESPILHDTKGHIEIHYNSSSKLETLEKEIEESKKILKKIDKTTSLKIESMNYKDIENKITSILDSAYRKEDAEARVLFTKYKSHLSERDKKITLKWINYFHKNSFPKEINTIIFNANNKKNSEYKLGEYIQQYIDGFSFKPMDSWVKKEIYKKSKIIYINPKYQKVSEYLSFILFKDEQVLDYSNKSNYQGLKNRDLVIFIGEDFEKVY